LSSSTRVHRAIFCLLALTLVAVVTSVHLGRWPGSAEFAGLDFYDYYFAGVAVRRGASPYDVALAESLARQAGVALRVGSDFIYPPWFAAAMTLFTALSPRAAFALWSCGLFASLMATLWLLRARSGPWLTVALVAATPSVFCFFVGQVNHYVLLLVTAAWTLRRSRPIVAGALLGWAGAIKLAPLVLLAAACRRERARTWLGAGVVLTLCALMGAVALPGENTRWLTRVLPATGVLTAETAHFLNQGIAGFFARTLLANEWTTPWITPPLATVRALSSLTRLALVAMAALFALWIGQRRPEESWRAWSALVAVSVLVSPLAWEGTHVMVLFSLALSAGRVPKWLTMAVFALWAIERAIDLFARAPAVAAAVRSYTIVSSCLVWTTLALLVAIVAPVARRQRVAT
jgi:hypothetical protein